MDNKSIFKSTMFGGFERQSVLNYIYETFNSTQEAQEKLTAQIEEMSATRERLEESVKDLENRLAENDAARTTMNEELRGVKAKNTELATMLEELNEEIDRQQLIVKEKDEQISRLAKANSELEKKNAELEIQAAELAKGHGDLEKSKTQIGDLIIKSHLEAERILEQANTRAAEVAAEAEGIVAKSQREAEKIVEQAGGRAKELIAEAQAEAEQIVQAANRSTVEVAAHLSSFRDEISSLQEVMEEALGAMRDKFAAINKALDKTEGQMKLPGTEARPPGTGNHIVLAPQMVGEKTGQHESLSKAGEFF